MGHIEVKEGLDLPIAGKPATTTRESLPKPSQVSLNLHPFPNTKFKLLAKAGESVKLGQPIVLDKTCPERIWTSPASGVVKEVRRGLKRRLLDVVIEVDQQEVSETLPTVDPASGSREELLDLMLKGGMFSRIRQRPFDRLADPKRAPRAIFVKGVESAPFVPPAEMQVEGYEKQFQAGLTALSRLTDGDVHLVYRQGTDCKAFTEATSVQRHTISGPHPSGNVSVHIHHICPIETHTDSIWTLTAHDVVCLGELLLNGRHHVERVISIAGNGIHEDKRGYFVVREGYPIGGMIAGRNAKGLLRMISGDVLMGEKVEMDDFLGFHHFSLTVIPENNERELLHFFRLGTHKFTSHKTYLSGMLATDSREYEMTTNQHGEERAFVDGMIYQRVMPMQIPVMQLVKAILGDDFDTAEEMGLFEVAPEDFALPTFMCPCKIEMVDAVRDGLRSYAAEVLA